jgi:hypothetical protein
MAPAVLSSLLPLLPLLPASIVLPLLLLALLLPVLLPLLLASVYFSNSSSSPLAAKLPASFQKGKEEEVLKASLWRLPLAPCVCGCATEPLLPLLLRLLADQVLACFLSCLAYSLSASRSILMQ